MTFHGVTGLRLYNSTYAMDYGEAYEALEEFVESESYGEFEENVSDLADIHPDVEVFGDRAVFYVQIENSSLARDDYERRVLAEYREGEIGPVPFTEGELEQRLQGGGEVTIDETVLEPKSINFPEQRKAR